MVRVYGVCMPMNDSKNPLFIPKPQEATTESPVADRNPVLVPKPEGSLPHCPKCGSMRFGGRRVQGTVTFTCSSCKTQWQGGLQLPQDPTIPAPIGSYVPPLTFDHGRTRETQGKVIEVRRPIDQRSDFRKGALISEEDEEL